MGAGLTDLTFVEDDDLIGLADSGEAMGDDDGAATGYQLIDSLLDKLFRFGINGRCCLVQYQYRGIIQKRTDERQQLPLTEGKAAAPFHDVIVVTARQAHDKVMHSNEFGGFYDLFHRDLVIAEGNIVHDRP